MSLTQLHQLPTASSSCSEQANDAGFDCQDFEDGTLRTFGLLPSTVHESLLLTHVEGGRDSDGRVIWHFKGATGDA